MRIPSARFLRPPAPYILLGFFSIFILILFYEIKKGRKNEVRIFVSKMKERGRGEERDREKVMSILGVLNVKDARCDS